MTCIAGIARDNIVYMAADSRAMDERGEIMHLVHPKITRFRVGQETLLIGFCGVPRLQQVIELIDMSDYELDGRSDYLDICEIVEAFRDELVGAGLAGIVDGMNGAFLIGYHGKLFHIDGDFSVCENTGDYDAVGSGAPFALGNMFAWSISDGDALHAVMEAIQAAAKHSATVGGDIVTEVLES